MMPTPEGERGSLVNQRDAEARAVRGQEQPSSQRSSCVMEKPQPKTTATGKTPVVSKA